MDLLRALMRFALHPDPSQLQDEVRGAIARADARTWNWLLELMIENRITAHIGGHLEAHGLLDVAPPDIADDLRRASRQAVHRNFLRMLLYSAVLREMRKLPLEPVLLKSGALVALLHPELSYHQMGDIDFLVPADRVEDVKRILIAHDYRQVPTKDDSLSFAHRTGALLLDFHHRFRLFERFNLDRLVSMMPARHPALYHVRVLEPNAMLSHLIYHMGDHRDRMGYRLRWLLDIGLAMRHWSDQLDMQQIAALAPTPADAGLVLRTVAFFERELDLRMPSRLRRYAENVIPYTLSEVCRSQRVTSWPLSTARGWVRMLACAAGREQRGRRYFPHLSDPVEMIFDARRERRGMRSAAEILSNAAHVKAGTSVLKADVSPQ